jgi:hypothetical protein
MIVTVSPAVYNVPETVCSLNFATRCRSVELGQAKRQLTARTGSSSSSTGALSEHGQPEETLNASFNSAVSSMRSVNIKRK